MIGRIRAQIPVDENVQIQSVIPLFPRHSDDSFLTGKTVDLSAFLPDERTVKLYVRHFSLRFSDPEEGGRSPERGFRPRHHITVDPFVVRDDKVRFGKDGKQFFRIQKAVFHRHVQNVVINFRLFSVLADDTAIIEAEEIVDAAPEENADAASAAQQKRLKYLFIVLSPCIILYYLL